MNINPYDVCWSWKFILLKVTKLNIENQIYDFWIVFVYLHDFNRVEGFPPFKKPAGYIINIIQLRGNFFST